MEMRGFHREIEPAMSAAGGEDREAHDMKGGDADAKQYIGLKRGRSHPANRFRKPH